MPTPTRALSAPATRTGAVERAQLFLGVHAAPSIVRHRLRAHLAQLAPGRDHTVTTKDDFTEDEWSRIVRAPMVAGLAISLADPGGPIEAAKESMATIKS